MVYHQQKTVKDIENENKDGTNKDKSGRKIKHTIKHFADKIIPEFYQIQCSKLLRFQKTLISD